MGLRRGLALLLAASLSAGVDAQTPVEWAEKAMQAGQAGRVQEAEAAWEQAINGLQKSGDKPNLARAYLFRGLFLFDQKKRSEARTSLLKARELFVATSNDKGLGLVETQLGEIERILGNLPQAEAHLRQAVIVAERCGDLARKVEALAMLGRLLDGAQRWPEATAVYNDLAKYQRETSSPQLGQTLLTLGSLHQMQDLNRQALAYYAEAATLLKTAEPVASAAALQLRLERFPEALALYDELLLLAPGDAVYEANRAYTLERLGRGADALQAYDRWVSAHPEHAQVRDVQERRLLLLYRLNRQAEALAALPAEPSARARLLEKFGRHEDAMQTLSAAMARAEGRSFVRLANQLAVLQLSQHRIEAARATLTRALESAPNDSVLLGNLGETFLAAGESEKALPWMQRALLQMRKEAAPPHDIATTLNNIAAAEQRLGRWDESLGTLREAEQVAMTLARPHAIQGVILNLTGYGYAKLGRSNEALSYYRRALAVRRSQGDKRGEVVTLLNLGAALAESGSKSEARSFFEQAAAANREVADAELGITIDNNLADLEPTPEGARTRYLRALAGAGENALLRGTILASLSRTRAGTPAQRQAEANEAFALLQGLGAREQLFVLLPFYVEENVPLPGGGVFHTTMLDLLGDLLRGLPARSAGAFIQAHRDDLELATESAWRSGDAADLLECEERIRALAVLALTREVDLAYDGLPPELVQRSKSVQGRLEALLRRPPSREVNEDVRRLKLEFALVSDEMERLHLSSGALQQARPAAVQELQRSLGPEEALVEYVRLPDRWVAVVVQPSALQVVELGPKEPLNRSMEAAGKVLDAMDALPQVEAALASVSERMWMPVARILPATVRRVVLIPSGALYGLPMAALPQDGQPLIARFQVESGSSATSWLLSRRSRPAGTGALAAALGNFQPPWAGRGNLPGGLRSGGLAPLPATLAEVQQLARVLPATRVLREQAMTIRQLQDSCRGANLLHFATHGILDADQPLLGGLVAADGLVRVADVFNWKLDAQLAVLSACNTGKLKDGQEWVGLTRAFQHAGARTLLASLWAVSDSATAEWMGHFYTSLKAGQPLSAAVQDASLRTREKFPHPSHWAAFVLWGDGADRLQ